MLEAYGHADHGAIGCDIVCAGVSALLYGLTAYLEIQAASYPEGRLEISESEGRLYMKTERLEGQETAFAVAAAGLKLIVKAFPEAVRFTPLSGVGDQRKGGTEWKKG